MREIIDNKQYIRSFLIRLINHRSMAHSKTGCLSKDQLQHLRNLDGNLFVLRNSNLERQIRFVYDNRNAIEAIAPSPSGSHAKYRVKVLELVKDCVTLYEKQNATLASKSEG